MPSPPRERGRPKTRGSETEFVLFIQGIPAHCRWQELKDLVRQTALHIRQAVVYDDQHGFPTGLGQIIVKNEDEAWRTYRVLNPQKLIPGNGVDYYLQID
ncbi:RNA binding protein [Paecilomyces variotii No. 5]|uniref:RNA binding protein n=1 Tax=Byssochlamys spectabilis (strain No. 5 / NBRC 109023) TaxID=1356009 RepID=V5F956_BYSSN|nr:RNA binding protein [Paecilomyces variotii No. 5]